MTSDYPAPLHFPRGTALRHALPVLLLSFLGLVLGCGNPRPEATSSIEVVTSIHPLASWIQAIGGEDVTVTTLVPGGINPHTFDLTPAQLMKVGEAEVLVLNGAGLEPWSERILHNAPESLRVVTVTFGESLLADGHKDHGDLGNPHLWLDPVFAKKAVQKIANALIASLPAKSAAIAARAQSYTDSLDSLHRWIQTQMSDIKDPAIITFHASWDYFAARYGVRIAGTVESQPGRELSPGELATLISRIRREKIRLLVTEPQFPRRSCELLVQETGIRLATLDAIGHPPTDYLEMMRTNVALLRAGLQP